MMQAKKGGGMSHIVDLDTVRTTAEAAKELGITARRVRQVSSQMNIGSLVGTTILFTPVEVEQMRQRRTDRTPIRCWLRERRGVPLSEELEKT